MKKISRRSFLAAAGVSAAALALTACGGSGNSTAASTASSAAASTAPAGDAAAAASDPKVTLVYAEVNPLDTIVGQTGSHFKEKVEELTGGSVVVDVQASGVLGSENDVLDAILGGSTSIDISRISAFALTSYGCNKSKLLSIPFTFDSWRSGHPPARTAANPTAYMPRIFHRWLECAMIPGVLNPSTNLPVARLKISITTKRPAIIVRRSKFFIKIASRIPPAKHILDF